MLKKLKKSLCLLLVLSLFASTPAPMQIFAAEVGTQDEVVEESKVESEIESESEFETESEIESESESEIESEVESESESEIESEIVVVEAVKDLKVEALEYAVSATWEPVTLATSYKVALFEVTEEEEVQVVDEVETVVKVEKSTLVKEADTSSNAYIFKGLTGGKTYKVAVTAVAAGENIIESETVESEKVELEEVVLGIVSGLKGTNGECKATLSWTAVTKATAYEVSELVSGKRNVLSVVKTNKYTAKLSPDKNHTIQVRAIRSVNDTTIYGGYSKSIVVKPTLKKPSNIKNFKITAVENGIKLTWSKSSNATGYKIYMVDIGTGKRKFIDSTTATSYTVKELKAGTKYKFQIRAHRQINGFFKNSSFSKALTATPFKKVPGQVVRVQVLISNQEVELSWPAVENATGYKIYKYNPTKKKYERIKTTDKRYYTHTNLVNGKEYQYKVYAYRTVNGVTTTGKASSVIKATPKKLSTGWNTIGGKKYYYKDGKPLKGIQVIDGKEYYFDKETGVRKTGWIYRDGYKFYYDKKTGALKKDVSSIIGKQKSYVIKVNKKMNTVTVYAKDGSKGYIIPVKAFICSTGKTTPTGTFKMGYQWRWLSMMGPSWGQWVSQIKGDYLFHSVYYNQKNNNNALSVSAYNNLGTTCSHGCVRLRACDAKWIYDNTDSGTKIIIYNSSNAGPFGKPTAVKLPSWHTWDPTDPNMKYKCKNKGCH